MNKNKRLFIVAGLAWGDEGKGSVTDALCRRYNADVVFRFNGGGNCGHNVVVDDPFKGLFSLFHDHHCFSLYGSGSLAGAQTVLGRDVLVNPQSLLMERDELRRKGMTTSLLFNPVVDENCRIVTPFHVALNRMREMDRGNANDPKNARHGSCGKGIGETVSDYSNPASTRIIAKDLLDEKFLKAKLLSVQMRLGQIAENFITSNEAGEIFTNAFEVSLSDTLKAYDEFSQIARIASREQIAKLLDLSTVVCEGGQGALLDETHGFHPYTTWSSTTARAAENAIFHYLDYKGKITKIGVLRTYMTRHGNGPFPTEDLRQSKSLLRCIKDDHNRKNEWQGDFRLGWLDLELLRYGVAANGGVDCLAVTHVDGLHTRDWWPVVQQYGFGGRGVEFCLGSTLGIQEAVGKRLMGQVERGIAISTDDILPMISKELNAPIWIESYGPKASDKHWNSEVESNLALPGASGVKIAPEANVGEKKA